jgi:hypothetical protein
MTGLQVMQNSKDYVMGLGRRRRPLILKYSTFGMKLQQLHATRKTAEDFTPYIKVKIKVKQSHKNSNYKRFPNLFHFAVPLTSLFISHGTP